MDKNSIHLPFKKQKTNGNHFFTLQVVERSRNHRLSWHLASLRFLVRWRQLFFLTISIPYLEIHYSPIFMKSSKIALSVFFALTLAVVCLVAAVSIDGLAMGENGFDETSVWFAVGGFALGLISGIIILKFLSPRTLSVSSLILGSLAFIAIAILFYFYYQNQEREEKSNSTTPQVTSVLKLPPSLISWDQPMNEIVPLNIRKTSNS
jgi:hypothetical protein